LRSLDIITDEECFGRRITVAAADDEAFVIPLSNSSLILLLLCINLAYGIKVPVMSKNVYKK